MKHSNAISFVSFAILSFIGLSCGNNTVKTHEYELLDKDSVNMVEKNYYEDGTLESVVPLHNKQINGLAKQYFKNGKLNMEANYVNGVKQGISKWYFDNGVAFFIVNFKDGRREGIAKRYDSNGKLIAEIPYKDDEVIEGLKEYDKHGKIINTYPTIQFKKVGKYNLQLSLSSGSDKVSFYQLKMNTHGEYFKKYIDTKNGKGELEILMTSSNLENGIVVYAEYLTSMQNMMILKGTYSLR
jgi:hypothetical protein